MKYRVRHITEYEYQEPVSVCLNRVCLTPVHTDEHECLSSEIDIEPMPDEINYRTDFFGNTVCFFSSYKEHDRLQIRSESVVDLHGRGSTAQATLSPMLWSDVKSWLRENNDDAIQYTLPSHYVPFSEEVRQFALDCFPEDATLWAGCNSLMQKIFKSVEFKPGFTTINTPVEYVLKVKKGVCQDFAHLMICCLRNLGLAAKYVSGYIETLPPPGKEKLVGSDASHAWVSVYFPGIGWVEFDPTNALLPSYKHITVAYGCDYNDVSPIRGIVFSSGKQNLTVKVDVQRIE